MAKKGRNCNKGYSCKYACISRSKRCQNPVGNQGRTYIEFLMKNPDWKPTPAKASLSELHSTLSGRGIDLSSLRGNGRGRDTVEKAIAILDSGGSVDQLRQAGLLKPTKVESALARSRREVKEQRQQEANKVSQEFNLAQQRLDLIARQYGKPNTLLTRDEAKLLGVKPGPYRPQYNELAAAQSEQKRLQDEMNSLATRTRVERFQPGKPLTQAQMERELSSQELQSARSFPTQQELQQIRYTNPDRYDKLTEQINQFNNVQNQVPGLTQQEYLAINAYTRGNGYIAPNAAARGFFQDPNSESARQATTQARLTHSALGRLPAWEGVVRRDTQIPASTTYKPGDTIRFDGVTSTSRDLSGGTTSAYGAQGQTMVAPTSESTKASKYDEVAQSMGINTLPPSDRQRVRYIMEVRSGRDISRLSAASSEQEISLRHGWSGTVSRTETDANGVTNVYVTES